VSTVESSKRKPNARSKEKRDRVARAVIELVDELGHENVTTALVAQRSGVAEATVLYHFPTKDHLLVAGQLFLDDEQVAALGLPDNMVTEQTEFSAEDFRRYDAVDDNRARLYLMIKGMSSVPGHPAHDYYAARLQRHVAMFATLVRGRIAAGVAHPDIDPEAAARQIIALWEGLGQMWMCDQTFSVGSLLASGIRRITGQNVVELRDALARPGAGL
jgi:AcrR family transcriptional regulator